MNTIYVVASHVQDAQAKISEIKAYRQITQPDAIGEALLVPVFQEADMRGRVVGENSMVVVCGDWSNRQWSEVQQLVEMFNSRRGGDRAPRLEYRTGEAPQPVFWQPTGDPIEIQTLNGGTYTIDPSTGGILGTPTTTTSAGVAWGQVLPATAQRAVDDARDEAKRQRNIADDMRTQVKKVQAENAELRSWLSGVMPIEDSEIPGLYRCGCCHRQLPQHVTDCPAA